VNPQSKLLPNHNVRKLVSEYKAKHAEESQVAAAAPSTAPSIINKAAPLMVRLTKEPKVEQQPPIASAPEETAMKSPPRVASPQPHGSLSLHLHCFLLSI